MNKKGELGTVMDGAQGTLLEAIHNEMKVKKLLISNSDTADDTQGEVTVQKSVSLKASKCSHLLIESSWFYVQLWPGQQITFLTSISGERKDQED